MRALARGQAVVETALFTMVFVTVLVFAVHFAEVGYLTVKVQEAANAALWDATSQKMHDTFANNWDHYRAAIAFGQGQSNQRYRDFNGLTSQDRAAALRTDNEGRALEMVQVFTNAESIETRCENIRDVSLLPFEPVRNTGIPEKVTGMACTSKSVLAGYNFPRWFLQNDAQGFFKAEHKKRKIGVCAAGRQDPRTGRCSGRYVIELDDWGFSGGRERQECELAEDGQLGCRNQGYFDEVKRTYDAAVARYGDGFGTQSSQLAKTIVGKSPLPGDENHFYLSFRGNESRYTEDLRRAHGDTRWETTPFDDRQEYRPYASRRDTCWLGHDCR